MAESQTQYPAVDISNGHIRAKLYLPDAENGFYRSTRFDWSGIIASLTHGGHEFYGPWFTKTDPPVRDFIYQGADIIAGAQSSATGPAEEFSTPQGYADAEPGGTFVKIGVGALRKPVEDGYSQYTGYEIVDAGTWTTRAHDDSVEFVQVMNDGRSGYGYEYLKTIRLEAGRPELIMAHSLKNIGWLPIRTHVYNHNFVVLDGAATGPDFEITVPFAIRSSGPPDARLAAIHGNRITYTRQFADRDTMYFVIEGHGTAPDDYDIRIENRAAGAGMRITADRPLSKLALWSIRSVVSVEPFVDVSTAPGDTTTWTYTYGYWGK